ncbi:MAG TPA: hypothetical protein VF787_06165 [Thermoanaerobaculia bacterium]
MKNAVTVLLLSSFVLFGACKKNAETAVATDTLATTETASATHPGSPGGTALVPDVVAGTTVLVLVQEGSIAVQAQSIPPGPAILTVENRGTEVHNLYIEGEGINRAAGDTIAQGATVSVDVNFKPGTYTLYCPIGDHRTKGEEVKLTIGTATGAPTDTNAATGS